MDVSLVILTWNRRKSVEHSLTHNIMQAGFPIREIVHIDNGSEGDFADWFQKRFEPSVQVRHRNNQGVARGYNRGLAMATSSHVVITGCDRIMPVGWLSAWVDCFKAVPNTGVISCYTGPYEERVRGHRTTVNGVTFQRAIPVEARMHSKNFLYLTGYFREDFGLYGFEDAEWSDRAEKRALEHGLLNYIVPGLGMAKHLKDDDSPPVGNQTYAQWKKTIHPDPKNKALWLECHHRNSPHYNPYARYEPDVRAMVKL